MAGFGADSPFPSISSDFSLGWHFSDLSGDGPGDVPQVSFDNVQLQPRRILQPLRQADPGEIQAVTEPIQPVIDFLNSPVPMISQLLGKSITWIDIAKDFNALLGDLGIELPNFRSGISYIVAADQIINLVNNVPNLGDDVFFKLGSFDLGNIDVRGLTDLDARLAERHRHAPDDIDTQLNNGDPSGNTDQFFKDMQDVGDSKDEEKLSFRFFRTRLRRLSCSSARPSIYSRSTCRHWTPNTISKLTSHMSFPPIRDYSLGTYPGRVGRPSQSLVRFRFFGFATLRAEPRRRRSVYRFLRSQSRGGQST